MQLNTNFNDFSRTFIAQSSTCAWNYEREIKLLQLSNCNTTVKLNGRCTTDNTMINKTYSLFVAQLISTVSTENAFKKSLFKYFQSSWIFNTFQWFPKHPMHNPCLTVVIQITINTYINVPQLQRCHFSTLSVMMITCLATLTAVLSLCNMRYLSVTVYIKYFERGGSKSYIYKI